MATTHSLKPIIHRPSWEQCGVISTSAISPSQMELLIGFYSPYFDDDFYFYVPSVGTSAANCFRFSARLNSWEKPGSRYVTGSLSGSPFRNSAQAAYEYAAPAGTILLSASAGTTTGFTTGLTIHESIVGRTVRIIEVPNAGQEFKIKSYTKGANSVFTFETSAASAFTSSTKFHLLTGSIWYVISNTSFMVYDLATRTYTARSSTNLPTMNSSYESALMPLHRAHDNFATGNISSATLATATIPSSFSSYNFSNFEIFIVSGTGAGQIRRISSQASNVLTLAANWTTTPDATSVFKIRGDSNSMIFAGGQASANMYKFDIAANTWTQITLTTPARTMTTQAAATDWRIMRQVPEWNTPSVGTGIPGGQNGRFIVSIRQLTGTPSNGGIDYYDIATNGWQNFDVWEGSDGTTNSGYCDDEQYIYSMEYNTGEYYRINIATLKWDLLPLNVIPHSATSAVPGDRHFIVKFNDGGSDFKFCYSKLVGDKREFIRLPIYF